MDDYTNAFYIPEMNKNVDIHILIIKTTKSGHVGTMRNGEQEKLHT
jgi:hypothetical protein